MNKLITIIILALSVTAAAAEERVYVEASSLTLTGKLFPNTPNPYNRVDTCKYKGFTPYENTQVRMSAGIGVAFRTNSPKITVRTKFERMEKEMNSAKYSLRGYDLYMKTDDGWDFVGNGACRSFKPDNDETIADGLGTEMKEFILYLPLFSIEKSIEIGIDKGCTVQAIANPFKKRIALYGSSFMHGNCTSRPGMAFPSQMSRLSGYQFLNMGVGGNCRMQPYFTEMLCKADVDAFVFDTFSNPDAAQISERLFPFIERIRAAHPGIPMIFMSTIEREHAKFIPSVGQKENKKYRVADSLMSIACQRYPDVYWLKSSTATLPHGDASADGVHPNDYGYAVWTQAVCGEITSILNRYEPCFKGLEAAPFPQMNQKEFERQYALNKAEWDKAFKFLRNNDLEKLKPGRYELGKNGTYVMIQEKDIDPSSIGRFENHKKYVDLQYVFDGKAILYLCPMSEVKERSTEYSSEKDVEFFNLATSCEAVTMDRNYYLILFPGDAHMPDRPAEGVSKHIRKIVVKIPYCQ